MLPSHIGNRDPGPRGFLQDPQLLVDGIPPTALNTRINLNTLCIRRHSRITRLTPSSYLRQHCPAEMGAAPPRYFSYYLAFAIFLIYITRVFVFYFGPDEHLIGIIPDDAFYYIQLAKHRLADGFWTFDGTSPATGFHILYGYILVAIFHIFPTIDWRELYLAVGILSATAMGFAALICAITASRLYSAKAIPLIAVPFLSAPVLSQSTSMMESWLVIFLSAMIFYGLTTDRPIPNKLFVIGLFTLGILGSLARTDFGMLLGAIFIVALVTSRFRKNTALVRAFVLLSGATCGVVITLAHNYFLSGTFFQASAQVKFYWSSVSGHSPIPIVVLLSEMLMPISAGIFGYISFWIAALGFFCLASFRASRAPEHPYHSQSSTVFFASSLTVIGYIIFYRYNSGALQQWYSANLVLPVAFCTIAILSYVLRDKVLTLAIAMASLSALLAIYRIQAIPYPHQYGMLQAGQFLKNQSNDHVYGSWNAGIISYFSEKPLVNIDGLTNDEVLPFIKSNRLFDYLESKGITYLIDYEEMLTNKKLRKRGGYDDSRVDRCITSITAVDNDSPKWYDGRLQLFAIKQGCD